MATAGVFGIIQGDEKIAQRIFQLAVDKAGVIRGNYYDAVADNTLPVYGSVNPKSQRAAWSIGEKKDIVFEAGLNNLTQTETAALVHYGKDRTEQVALRPVEAEGHRRSSTRSRRSQTGVWPASESTCGR